MRFLSLTVLSFVLVAGLGACSRTASSDQEDIVAASPSAITITSSRLSEPVDVAQAHCAKHGKKAISRGGVKLGSPYVRVMWGYDCVKE